MPKWAEKIAEATARRCQLSGVSEDRSLTHPSKKYGSFQCRIQRVRFAVQGGQLSPMAFGAGTPAKQNDGPNRQTAMPLAKLLICLRRNLFGLNDVSAVSTDLNLRALIQPDRFTPAARRNLPSALRSASRSLSSRECWPQVHGRPGRRLKRHPGRALARQT